MDDYKESRFDPAAIRQSIKNAQRAGVLPNRPEPTPVIETQTPIEAPKRTHEESMAVFHKILDESAKAPVEVTPPPSSNQTESMAKYHRILNQFEQIQAEQKQRLKDHPAQSEQLPAPTKKENKNIFQKVRAWFSRQG